MDGGCRDSAGNSFSRCASTDRRSSSKNGGSFIGLGEYAVWAIGNRSQFVLALGLKWFGGHFAICLLQQNFHTPFGLFKLFLAFSRQANTFFKQLHCLIQRK